VYCRINPVLSPGYLVFLKHELARFFGYNYWYGGVIKENNTPFKTYTRIKQRYSRRKHARSMHEAFMLKTLDSADWSRKAASNSQKICPTHRQQGHDPGDAWKLYGYLVKDQGIPSGIGIH